MIVYTPALPRTDSVYHSDVYVIYWMGEALYAIHRYTLVVLSTG
jgi:hypothetical protein